MWSRGAVVYGGLSAFRGSVRVSADRPAPGGRSLTEDCKLIDRSSPHARPSEDTLRSVHL